MRDAVVTSCSAAGWRQYGLRFVSTFCEYWPCGLPLTVVSEDELDGMAWHDSAAARRERHFIHLLDADPQARAFFERHANNPRAHGKVRESGQTWTGKALASGYNWRYDAFRFANKVFAIRAAARTTSHEPRATRLFWLDADVVTFEPVPLTLLDEVLPPDVALSCLDRGPYPSECGFVGYNLAHPATLPFIEALASLYASDEVFKLQEWHDSYVFDWLRRKGNVPAHCIPYAAGQKRHPFVNSALGRYMDHLKGPRKHLGKTPRGEVVTHRDVGYWRT